jgi:hypothetical protein
MQIQTNKHNSLKSLFDLFSMIHGLNSVKPYFSVVLASGDHPTARFLGYELRIAAMMTLDAAIERTRWRIESASQIR